MKKIAVPLIVVTILGGCVDKEVFAKNSVTYDQYERDYVACGTLASQAAPTNTQVAWAPYVGIYSVDTNEQLRISNFEICMRDKGYSEVKLPYCQGESAKAAQNLMSLPQNRQARMRIVSGSCYVLKPDQSPFIYSPAAG